MPPVAHNILKLHSNGLMVSLNGDAEGNVGHSHNLTSSWFSYLIYQAEWCSRIPFTSVWEIPS